MYRPGVPSCIRRRSSRISRYETEKRLLISSFSFPAPFWPTIVCMDSSKIGHIFLAHVASLEKIDVLITDNGITDANREIIERAHVQVEIAPPITPSSDAD